MTKYLPSVVSLLSLLTIWSLFAPPLGVLGFVFTPRHWEIIQNQVQIQTQTGVNGANIDPLQADFSRLNLTQGGPYCRNATYTIIVSAPIQNIGPTTTATMCFSPSTQQVSAHVAGFGAAFWDSQGWWFSWPEEGIPCVQSPNRTYANYLVLLNQLVNVEKCRGSGFQYLQQRWIYNNLVRDAQFGPTYGSELITTDQFHRWLTYEVSQTTGPNTPIPKITVVFQFDPSSTFQPTPTLLNRPVACTSAVPLYDNVFFPEPPFTCPSFILAV
jgi:hypothetical protein